MIQSSFLFANINQPRWQKMTKLSSSISIYFIACMKFMKSFLTNIKALNVFQQDIRVYDGNINVLRLRVSGENRLD